MAMQRIDDCHSVSLNEGKINDLFWDLNKELRKRLRKQVPKDFRIDLCVW